ncbi:MAG: spore germination protein [Oscillospiraceae bacterium]|nr:spore germination protein [Oscillospiraceae bacterium]
MNETKSALPTAEALRALFAGCADYTERLIRCGPEGKLRLPVCWLDGVVAGSALGLEILRPLTELLRTGRLRSQEEALERCLAGLIYRCSAERIPDLDAAAEALCRGCCLVLFEELGCALSFETRSAQRRAVGEPSLEKSLKGGKDSFTETLRVNTALVRQRLNTPALKLTESCLGRRSRTGVALLYMEGLAREDTVRELARRLDRIHVDALLSLGPLESGLADCPGSPFPQLLHTERPDRFAMHLDQGRVGILVDGLPVGLLLPASLPAFLEVTGDGSMHPLVSAALAALRWLALGIGLLLPGFYTAVALYHPEMIPTRLLLSIIRAEQDLPFSTALEVLGMLAAFSLLQEAGLRMPNPIGDTVSIIGALIVGQAAVEAKLVSPIAIIVVAVSGIACYTLPSQDLGFALRLGRLALLLGAILAGLYGLGLAGCLLLLHLSELESFGTPYLSPSPSARPPLLPQLRALLQRGKAP